MKKNYIAPSLATVPIEASDILCGSKNPHYEEIPIKEEEETSGHDLIGGNDIDATNFMFK